MRIHGGYLQTIRQDDFDASRVLDLSVNINPYGPQPELLSLVHEGLISQYPDPHARRLKKTLKESLKLEGRVAVGNGASELLWAAARAYLKPRDTFLTLAPTFSEFTTAALQVGAGLIEVACEVTEDKPLAFHHEWSRINEAMQKHQPKVLSLCNPNSPTGIFYDPLSIRDLARRFAQTIIVLDESFLTLSSEHAWASQNYPSNVVRIVSLTKDHAIPGIRLGYAWGDDQLIRRLERELPSWNVNGIAQEIGCYLATQETFIDSCRRRILADKVELVNELTRRQIPFVPSCTCFIMIAVQNPEEKAARLWNERQIMVRSCASYGFPDWWRIAVRPKETMLTFFQALDSLS